MKTFLNLVARGLLIVAALFSAYLAWQALAATGGIAGCGDGAGCDRVLSSSWAKVFGLPVALLGSLTYLSAAFFGKMFPRQKQLHLAILLLIPAAAVWFIAVQVFAIGSVCVLCCAAHLLASSGAIILLTRHIREESSQWIPSAAGATAAVALLGMVQTFSITNQAEAGASGAVVSVFELNDAPTKKIERLNEVALLDGKVIFKLDELPLVGVSQPKHVVVALTDYTCPHCRRLHDVLQDVGQKFDGEVAILKLPATREGTDSAQVHRHMLALWKINPRMHWTLERSLIEGRVNPTAKAVRSEAIRLVGANQFAEANVRHNRWINEQLANTRKVQDANRETTGKGTLPQVIIGAELLLGAHMDPEFYLTKISNQFGVAEKAGSKVAASDARRVRLENGVVVVGEITRGQSVPFTVTFTNRTREPMEISWLNMGAGITIEKFTRDEIYPDDTAELTFQLSVPDDARPGQFDRTITVNTSTGHEPVNFRVVASVGGSIAKAQTPVGE